MRALTTLLSLLILVTAVGRVPVAAADDSKARGERGSRPSSGKLVVPLTGTVVAGGAFTGSFTIHRFEDRGGTLHAIGMVSGIVSGPLARSGISGPLALPVRATSGSPLATRSAVVAQATCDVLHLSFGGITVDLLGLDVALSPVTIDLVGGPGPLGNLVCQVVALLDSAGDVLGVVVGLLNTLLGLVGGLVGGVA
jgi:hypothetical protein